MTDPYSNPSPPSAPYGAPSGPAYSVQQPGAHPSFGGPAHPPPGSGGTSGFAIASLIFGILGGVLLSVIFGIVALTQIRKRGQTGRGMAIAGLVISGCWVLLIAVGATIAILTDSGEGGRSSNGAAGTVAVTTLKPGNCVGDIKDSAAIEDLPVVSCSVPHEGEVYAVFNLPAGAWPGDAAVQQQAEKLCEGELAAYAPDAPETVKILYLHPLRESWSSDRGVTCVATDPKGKVTGSIRD